MIESLNGPDQAGRIVLRGTDDNVLVSNRGPREGPRARDQFFRYRFRPRPHRIGSADRTRQTIAVFDDRAGVMSRGADVRVHHVPTIGTLYPVCGQGPVNRLVIGPAEMIGLSKMS